MYLIPIGKGMSFDSYDQGCQNRDSESDRSSVGRIVNRRIITTRIVES